MSKLLTGVSVGRDPLPVPGSCVLAAKGYALPKPRTVRSVCEVSFQVRPGTSPSQGFKGVRVPSWRSLCGLASRRVRGKVGHVLGRERVLARECRGA